MEIVSEIVVLLFAVFSVLPLLLSLLAKMIRVVPEKTNKELQCDFACIITAYKDIECASHLLSSLTQQQYAAFHIYLVADDCERTESVQPHEKLTIIYPSAPLHSKVKSIVAGMEAYVRPHTHLIIFDPDNLAHPYYLRTMNAMHQRGFEVVQGKRVAKNLETKFACLDAFSEYYYNYTQRTVPFHLGSSATIAGSAMSLSTPLYTRFLKEEMEQHGDKLIIAEDKMLQMYVVNKGHRIAFAETALVYDEKVSTAHQVKRQRTRWITSYFQYLLTGFTALGQGLLKFNWNKIMFAYMIIIPPMFIMGFVWFFASALLLFVSLTSFMLLQVCLLAFVLNIFVALFLGNAPAKVIKSLFFAPFFVLNQVKALFSMKDTKTSFLTTEKTQNLSIDDMLNSKL